MGLLTPRTWEAKAGGCQFKASLGYTVNCYLKTSKQENKTASKQASKQVSLKSNPPAFPYTILYTNGA